MADKTMTAPLAVIKVNGIVIGRMKSIRCTENIRHGKVVGIGRVAASEMPVLDWNGTLNCGAFLIDLRKEVIPGSHLRTVQTIQQWEDTLVLNDGGVQIDILRKVTQSITAGGIYIPKLEVVASVKGCFMNRESFDISEGQISGRDCDFEYITPILFPL
jgi:hypothetical protein